MEKEVRREECSQLSLTPRRHSRLPPLSFPHLFLQREKEEEQQQYKLLPLEEKKAVGCLQFQQQKVPTCHIRHVMGLQIPLQCPSTLHLLPKVSL